MADPMTTDTAALVARLRELAEKATPGPWEADSEKDEHGMMFATMHSGAQPYYALFDSMNADYRVVSCEQEYDDEGGVIAWDETARRNFALIAELRNALPTILSALESLSAPAPDGEVEVERVARAIYNSRIPKGGKNYMAFDALCSNDYHEEYDSVIRDARAAIAALPRRDGMREAPSEPGGFVGDIFYGNPVLTTEGTHRWTGSEWERLPSDVELLTKMLAASREREMPAEMDHEMQMVWQAAWYDQSVIRHKARFKSEQPISCEAAAWKAVGALLKGRARAARAALKGEA